MAGLSREGCPRSRMEDGLCVNELTKEKTEAFQSRRRRCGRPHVLDFSFGFCKIRVEQNRQGNYLKLGHVDVRCAGYPAHRRM